MEKIDNSTQNRDLRYHPNKHLWFEPVNDNTYTIHTDLDYLLEYACINYDPLPENDEEYDFVSVDQNGVSHKGHIQSYDPSGGPYMSIDTYMIGDRKLKRIYQKDKKTYFEVEDAK